MFARDWKWSRAGVFSKCAVYFFYKWHWVCHFELLTSLLRRYVHMVCSIVFKASRMLWMILQAAVPFAAGVILTWIQRTVDSKQSSFKEYLCYRYWRNASIIKILPWIRYWAFHPPGCSIARHYTIDSYAPYIFSSSICNRTISSLESHRRLPQGAIFTGILSLFIELDDWEQLL